MLGDADEGIEGVQADPRVLRQTPSTPEAIVDYELRPPAGGIHNPVWWNCGFYDEPSPTRTSSTTSSTAPCGSPTRPTSPTRTSR